MERIRVVKKKPWVYKPARRFSRRILLRALADEIEWGNCSLSKLYSSLLVKVMVDAEPKLKCECWRLDSEGQAFLVEKI